MDGSAAPFVDAIDQVGLDTLPMPRRYIRVLKPVRVAMRRRLSASCGRIRTASGSRPRSTSIIR